MLVHCRVCASHPSGRWAGACLPHRRGDAEALAGTERAGWGSRGGGRNRVQNHGSHHAVSTVGTKRGRGVDATPACPGCEGGVVPTWGGEVGQLQFQKLGGGAARQEAGIDWWPVDVPSSAPSTQPGLIGLFVYINFFFFFFFNFLTFSLEKGWVRALGWHPSCPPRGGVWL